MDQDEGRSNSQPTPHLLQAFWTLVTSDEMENQNGCGSIERSGGSIIDVASVEAYA
jgi:hypothetical protein